MALNLFLLGGYFVVENFMGGDGGIFGGGGGDGGGGGGGGELPLPWVVPMCMSIPSFRESQRRPKQCCTGTLLLWWRVK